MKKLVEKADLPGEVAVGAELIIIEDGFAARIAHGCGREGECVGELLYLQDRMQQLGGRTRFRYDFVW